MNSRKSLWDIKTHVKQDHWFDDNASKKALPEKISYTCHKCRKRIEVDHTGVLEYQQFLLLKEFLSYIFSHSKGEYEESLPVTNN